MSKNNQHLLLTSVLALPKKSQELAFKEIKNLFSGVTRILCIPYARQDYKNYNKYIKHLFNSLGYQVDNITEVVNKKQAVNKAEAFHVGGGNSFRLLDKMYQYDLLENIRKRVQTGVPYIGVSAGANLVCPTIKTTNDMPIVYPPSLRALNLIPFQINAHYIEREPSSNFKGETRDQRIIEFHEENTMPVVALKEGAILLVNGTEYRLLGSAGAKVFIKGKKPREYYPRRVLRV